MRGMKSWVVVVVVVAVVAMSAMVEESRGYSFTVKRLFDEPIMSKNQSIFDYNYNSAYVPLYSSSGQLTNAILVRCQNNASNPQNPYEVTPSMMALCEFGEPQFELTPITNASVVFKPETPEENYGTEDPRVVYRNSTGVYYMFYSAVETDENGLACRLSLATATNPTTLDGWTRHGAIFPDVNGTQFTKSGALLIRDDVDDGNTTHYLFWGDSSIVKGLQYATTTNLLNYTNVPEIWLPVRNESYFDSVLVEAGPYPIRLSDGNYLFLYNSARAGYPSVKPNWDLQYNLGWVILNGTNPVQILERSNEPIFSPELPWEINGLTPNVVFVEGWQQVAPDTFVIYYGAADTYVGAAILQVQV